MQYEIEKCSCRRLLARRTSRTCSRRTCNQRCSNHMAEMGFTKTTRREMGDELTCAQISSKPAIPARKTSAVQKAVGALCNEGGSGGGGGSSGRTALRHHHAGVRRVGGGLGGQARWTEARCVRLGPRGSTAISRWSRRGGLVRTSIALYDSPNTFQQWKPIKYIRCQGHRFFSTRRGCGPVAVSRPKDDGQALREASLRAQSRYQQIRWHDIPGL